MHSLHSTPLHPSLKDGVVWFGSVLLELAGMVIINIHGNGIRIGIAHGAGILLHIVPDLAHGVMYLAH